MLKKLLFFILLTASLISYAQPNPRHRYREKIHSLEQEALNYPDSLALHYRLFELYRKVGNKKQAFDKINFLLSKKPNSTEYLTSKFGVFLAYPYTESNIKKAYQFYLENLEPKIENCTKKQFLSKIGGQYETIDRHNKALLFYDKALNMLNCDKENAYILVKKQKLYHEIKDYKNSYDILKKLDRHPSYIEYNTIYVGNYKQSIKDLYALLEEDDGVVKKGNKYYIDKDRFSPFSRSIIGKKILRRLAYNYYKLGELDKALTILHILTEVSFGADLFQNYRYWCMYLDLYEKYKNTDYRVHLLLAHRYISESDRLTSTAFYQDEIPQKRCDPHKNLNIPSKTNEEEEAFVISLAIKEITIAEKLAHKKFDLYRANALIEMKKMDEAKTILDRLIQKNPNDIETLFCIRNYYFSMKLDLVSSKDSKKNLKRKEKYERLQKETYEKYEKLTKESKKDPVVIQGY